MKKQKSALDRINESDEDSHTSKEIAMSQDSIDNLENEILDEKQSDDDENYQLHRGLEYSKPSSETKKNTERE